MELKPCPFCGANAEMRYHPSCMRDPSHRAWEVGCSICDARVGNTIYAIGKTRDEAIAAWNTRAERTCKLPETRIDHGSIEYNGTTEWRRCSGCGAEVLAYPARYCPKCGAKVVE